MSIISLPSRRRELQRERQGLNLQRQILRRACLPILSTPHIISAHHKLTQRSHDRNRVTPQWYEVRCLASGISEPGLSSRHFKSPARSNICAPRCSNFRSLMGQDDATANLSGSGCQQLCAQPDAKLKRHADVLLHTVVLDTQAFLRNRNLKVPSLPPQSPSDQWWSLNRRASYSAR